MKVKLEEMSLGKGGEVRMGGEGEEGGRLEWGGWGGGVVIDRKQAASFLSPVWKVAEGILGEEFLNSTLPSI
jgi:hypothetical protein